MNFVNKFFVKKRLEFLEKEGENIKFEDNSIGDGSCYYNPNYSLKIFTDFCNIFNFYSYNDL
jgi:hypothetical protein